MAQNNAGRWGTITVRPKRLSTRIPRLLRNAILSMLRAPIIVLATTQHNINPPRPNRRHRNARTRPGATYTSPPPHEGVSYSGNSGVYPWYLWINFGKLWFNSGLTLAYPWINLQNFYSSEILRSKASFPVPPSPSPITPTSPTL